MKLITTIVLVLVACSSVLAQKLIPAVPDYTLLWSRFSSVVVVDSFMLATSPMGIVLFQSSSGSTDFLETDHVWMNSEPIKQKISGDIDVVQTSAGVMYFLDLRQLPRLVVLGNVDVGQGIVDFSLRDSNLYICARAL
jgi:hypothetical protein